MGSDLKGRRVKPGAKSPLREDYECIAVEAITAGQICYVAGEQGEFLKVGVATNATYAKARCDLLVSRGAVASGGRGRFSPFITIKTVATTGATIGDPVYLGTAGLFTLTRPTAQATWARVVGYVTSVGAVGTGTVEFGRANRGSIVVMQKAATNGVATITFTAAGANGLAGKPVVATMNTADGTLYIMSAEWSTDDLVVTLSGNATTTPTITVMIAE